MTDLSTSDQCCNSARCGACDCTPQAPILVVAPHATIVDFLVLGLARASVVAKVGSSLGIIVTACWSAPSVPTLTH